jgi:hypothetical protein
MLNLPCGCLLLNKHVCARARACVCVIICISTLFTAVDFAIVQADAALEVFHGLCDTLR